MIVVFIKIHANVYGVNIVEVLLAFILMNNNIYKRIIAIIILLEAATHRRFSK